MATYLENPQFNCKVVLLIFTPEIEVLYALSIGAMTSINQLKEYFNSRCKIQLDHPVHTRSRPPAGLILPRGARSLRSLGARRRRGTGPGGPFADGSAAPAAARVSLPRRHFSRRHLRPRPRLRRRRQTSE